ncbi:hypothetical protein [Streptomyces sp. NPDC048527]|uniref:hypothetical protein n=1 Tax=Streptomyces sp. NPDC048527 TaxID=3365568 RepID=UPI0037207017
MTAVGLSGVWAAAATIMRAATHIAALTWATSAALFPRLLVPRTWMTAENADSLSGTLLALLGAFAVGLLLVHARSFVTSASAPEGLSLTFPVTNAAAASVLW